MNQAKVQEAGNEKIRETHCDCVQLTHSPSGKPNYPNKAIQSSVSHKDAKSSRSLKPLLSETAPKQRQTTTQKNAVIFELRSSGERQISVFTNMIIQRQVCPLQQNK